MNSIIFFFFSSRRRHTRYIGDWSSDVCSSDLPSLAGLGAELDDRRLAAPHHMLGVGHEIDDDLLQLLAQAQHGGARPGDGRARAHALPPPTQPNETPACPQHKHNPLPRTRDTPSPPTTRT